MREKLDMLQLKGLVNNLVTMETVNIEVLDMHKDK